MKPASKRTVESNNQDPRSASTEQGIQAAQVEAANKEGAAMVDALEDILAWERASERALKVAAERKSVAPSDLTN